MRAQELLNAAQEVVTPHDSVAKAARLMRGRGVVALGVVENRDNNQAIGVVTDRHLLLDCVAAGHEPRRCPLWNHVQRDAPRLGPDDEADMPESSGTERRAALVVDPSGRLLGVIE